MTTTGQERSKSNIRIGTVILLAGWALVLQSCSSKSGFSLNDADPKLPLADHLSVASASLTSSTLSLSGSSLDSVTEAHLIQNDRSVPLQILDKTASSLKATFADSAFLSRAQMAKLLLTTAQGSTTVSLTVDLSGTVVTNFTSTGISDLATGTALTVTAENMLGIGTLNPSNRLVVGDDSNGATLTPGNSLAVGNSSGNSTVTVGQNPTNRGVLSWVYNDTVGDAFLHVGTASSANPLALQANGGNVGIGTTNPKYNFHVVGTTNAEFSVEDYGGGNGVLLRTKAANGTPAAPTAATAATTIGGLAMFGYNGSSFVRGARIFANPSGTWSGSTNGSCLMFETAPDNSASAASIERMRIDQNGNVGIGTTSPAATLSVVSSNGGADSNWYNPANYAAQVFNSSNSAQHYGLLVSDYWHASENFIFAVDARNYVDGTVANDTHSAAFIVKGDGNVGIGTATPLYTLDVNGAVRASSFIGPLNSSSAQTAGVYTINSNSDNLGLDGGIDFQVGGTTRMTVNNSGYVGIGTGVPKTELDTEGSFSVHDGGVLSDYGYSGAIRITRAASAGQHINFVRSGQAAESLGYQPNTNIFGFGGATPTDSLFAPSHLAIDLVSGNVGIGTTAPVGKLHVSGGSMIVTNTTDPEIDITSTAGNGRLGTPTTAGHIAAGSLAQSFVVTNDTGPLQFGTGTTAPSSIHMTIDTSGNVGIGTTTPGRTLDISGSGVLIQRSLGANPAGNIDDNSLLSIANTDKSPEVRIFDITTDSNNNAVLRAVTGNTIFPFGFLGIGMAPSYALHVKGAGGATVGFFTDGVADCSIAPSSTGLTCSSDERLKRDIRPFKGADSLGKVLRLNTVSFAWRKIDNGRHTGYIAQEVEKIAPEIVTTDHDGFKQVSYTGLVPWITGAIKEFYTEFGELRSEVAVLQKDKIALETQNASLRTELTLIQARHSDLETRLKALERAFRETGGH